MVATTTFASVPPHTAAAATQKHPARSQSHATSDGWIPGRWCSYSARPGCILHRLLREFDLGTPLLDIRDPRHPLGLRAQAGHPSHLIITTPSAACTP